jgi:hypothetical protein
MKKILLSVLPLILIYNIHAANNETLGKFTDEYPNIIMGEVYYVTQTSFFITVDLEFKGNLESKIFEVPFDGTSFKKQDVKNGEKALVFVNKMLMKPIENMPYVSFKLSKFDKFYGQCVFRFMNSELDNDFLSQLTSVLYQKQLAAVYTY